METLTTEVLGVMTKLNKRLQAADALFLIDEITEEEHKEIVDKIENETRALLNGGGGGGKSFI